MPDAKMLSKRLEENEKLLVQLQKSIGQIRSAFLEELSKDDARKGDALIVSLKQQLDLTKDELVRTKEELGSAKGSLDEKSRMLDNLSSQSEDVKAELDSLTKENLSREAELSIIRKRITPILEENKELARTNANIMQELTMIKQDLQQKEKELHDKDSHFNLIMENIRNDAQKKLKDAIDMDSRTIISLRSEIEKLKIDTERKDALLREREAKEKELMVDVVGRFRELFGERALAEQGNIGEILPIIDAALQHGDKVDVIKGSLKRMGYNDSSIDRAFSLLKKGI